MTLTHKIYCLLGGLLCILFLASSIAYFLGQKNNANKNSIIIKNLKARINAWWMMVIIFALTLLAGKMGALILFACISFFALREFITLTPTKAADHAALSVAFFCLIPLQYYLIAINWYGLFSILIPVYAFLLLPTLSAIAQDTDNFLARSAKIQWGVMISIYCISHAPALLLLDIPQFNHQNILLLFYLLLIVQISDVLQYVFGMLLGKTQIAPIVSPSKTLEGLVGGGLSATAIGASLWWITPFTPLQSAIIAFIIVITGFLGGLVLSAIKRSFGAKDWGNMIQGHGGMLDRMDSVSFAAPVFFHIVRYFFVP